MVRFFVFVIAIWCVCYSLVFFFPDCSVPSVLCSSGFSHGFRLFWFGTLTVGRYREAASCAILQVLSGGSLLLSSCSRVSQNSDTICFVLVIVETWVSYNRVGPEDIVMVFNKFQSMAQTLRVCCHFESGRGSLQAWADVDSTGDAEGFLYLAVDVVLHAASKDVCSVF